METTNEGMRLEVKGPKGSGKTVLLIYLAHLSKIVFEQKQNRGRVFICDGNISGSDLLLSQLTEKMEGVVFVRDYRTINEQLKNVSKNDIVFFDETHFNVHSNFLEQLNQRVHCCVFSSDGRYGAINSFSSLYLTQTLRSTSCLHFFFNNLLEHNFEVRDMNGAINHGLIGTSIPYIEIYRAGDGYDITDFWGKCVETVSECSKKSLGMPEILAIVDFLSHKSQLNVLSLLKRNNLNICSLSYSNILFECVYQFTHHSTGVI